MGALGRLRDRVRGAWREKNLYDQAVAAAAAASEAEKKAREAETTARIAQSAARAAKKAAKGYQKAASQKAAAAGTADVQSAATSAMVDSTLQRGAVSEAQRIVSSADTDQTEQADAQTP